MNSENTFHKYSQAEPVTVSNPIQMYITDSAVNLLKAFICVFVIEQCHVCSAIVLYCILYNSQLRYTRVWN